MLHHKVLLGCLIFLGSDGFCGAFVQYLSNRDFHSRIFSLNIIETRSSNRLSMQSKVSSDQTSVTKKFGGKFDPNSFVQNDMRKIAMAYHTKDQAPKEGKMETTGKKFTEWKPTLTGYLQFLVDSLEVYKAFDSVIGSTEALAAFRDTKLERAAPLSTDIKWMVSTYPELSVPPPTSAATEYIFYLQSLVVSSLPKFVCHYYNHYFAHTAGGLMIGRKVSDSILGGKKLAFYDYGDSDVRALLDDVRQSIDAMATAWSPEERDECLNETPVTFKYGGALVRSITEA